MTETERIIKSGILSETFFQPEYRNDFYVDDRRKRIWGISLDLLLTFSEVCRKHDLTWYLMFGSLLGAVRHGGFIPWDDDVDVAMPRKDYEVLLTLKEEFPSPYFLQTPYTDNGYYYSYAKIRNSNTTSLSKGFGYQGYNQGISLDIFCVDSWDIDGGEALFEKIKSLIINNSIAMKMSNPNLRDELTEKAPSLKDPMQAYGEMQRLSTLCTDEHSPYVSLPTLTLYGYSKDVFHREDFENVLMKQFERFEFPVPCGYERILKTVYGNYWELPPIEERGKWHAATIDPDIPYTEYVKRFLGT